MTTGEGVQRKHRTHFEITPQVFQNYVNSIGPMFHSVYELKQRTEGIKLRWAIPWIFAQTWNWSQTFCSPGWCYIGYLFLWIPLQVPAMEVVCICIALFPLCSLWELTEIFPCSLGLELGEWEGCKLMAVSRGLTDEHVGKKRRHYPPPEVLWNLGWKFSRKTNCPHAPLSSAASLRSINSVWNL